MVRLDLELVEKRRERFVREELEEVRLIIVGEYYFIDKNWFKLDYLLKKIDNFL